MSAADTSSSEEKVDSSAGETPIGDRPAVRPPNRLLWHMYVSYFWLRFGMGALAFIMPAVVIVSYALANSTMKPLGSLSEYYNAGFAGLFFTGSLFAVGVGLLIYRGYTTAENWALNLAGVCVRRCQATGEIDPLPTSKLTPSA